MTVLITLLTLVNAVTLGDLKVKCIYGHHFV